MFKLSKLKIGQKANAGHLKNLIENQNYTRCGNGIIGEAVLWANGNNIEEYSHLNACPDNTIIEAREEYYGKVTFTKRNGEWFVTTIRTH